MKDRLNEAISIIPHEFRDREDLESRRTEVQGLHEARDVDFRWAALDAEAKSIATETGERHKFDSLGKGSVSISRRKEKEYFGPRRSVLRSSARDREAAPRPPRQGIIKLEDH
jgi:hypothetical protein